MLQYEIAPLLIRPVGRPPKRPVILYDDFWYRAGSWDRARRVVAKVEWYRGELFPRVGFIVSAQGGQALVAAERAGQADQDGRPSGAALPAVDLSVVRGVGSSKVVPGSVGSYRPVIAGAKLRENATTILPRGRALQGVGLSSMRFHPIGGGPDDDKDGQET